MTEDDPDAWGEDLGDLTHPSDRRDVNGTYVCRYDDCGATFDSLKSLSLHETGSHTTVTCRICGDSVGIRGLSKHEEMCRHIESGAFDDILPRDALRARLRDWLERADVHVDRPNVFCIVCEEGEPEFVRDVAIAGRIRDRGACFLFPACRISPELFRATPRRDRRTGTQAVTDAAKSTYEAPLLGGS